jgi:tripeptidyl-peptidase I
VKSYQKETNCYRTYHIKVRTDSNISGVSNQHHASLQQRLNMQVILTTLIACGLLHYGQSFLGHSEPLEAPLGYVPSNAHVFKEAIPHFSSRRDIVQRSILQPDHVHQLEFVLQLRNMDELERIVHDIANPLSANYGQHMSAEQVNAMTMNPEGRDAIVNYLHANGATVVGETLNSEFITATAPISVWNKVLHTEFSLFHQEKYDGKIEQQVRAETYSIPNELDDHVTCVLNAVDLPVVIHGGVILPLTNHEVKLSAEMHTSADPAFYTGWILPKILTKYYNVTGYSGSAQSTQAVYGGNEDYFSPKSLAYFQKEIAKIPVQAAIIKNGYASEDPTKDYSEGNLDIQYVMSVSQKSPTTYWHTYTGVGLWLRDVLLTTNIPLVLSISYGAEEKYTSMGEHQTFTTAAIKMAATGITIAAASGDDGANTRKSCSYSPIYPSSNPYVLSIGATAVSFLVNLQTLPNLTQSQQT